MMSCKVSLCSAIGSKVVISCTVKSSMGGWAILTLSQSRLLSNFCPSLNAGLGFGTFFIDSVFVVVVVDVVEVEVVLGLEEAFFGVILAEVGKVGSIPNILTMVGKKAVHLLLIQKRLQISEKLVT